MGIARKQLTEKAIDQLHDYRHASRRWVYKVHLNPLSFVDAALACLGFAPDSGITLMIPEQRPNETFIVLPKDRVKYLALDGGAAQKWRG